jgi:hypothetical protein
MGVRIDEVTGFEPASLQAVLIDRRKIKSKGLPPILILMVLTKVYSLGDPKYQITFLWMTPWLISFLITYGRKLNTLFNIREQFIVEGARIRLDTSCLN